MNLFFKAIYLNLFVVPVVIAASAEDISVKNAYVRGLPPSVQNTSAYMTIINLSGDDLVLIGATTDIADSVSIHRTEEKNGMISMVHVMSATVPANGELILESGGMHLMIMKLKSSINTDDNVIITLQFQGGLEKTISFPVRSVLVESLSGP